MVTVQPLVEAMRYRKMAKLVVDELDSSEFGMKRQFWRDMSKYELIPLL